MWQWSWANNTCGDTICSLNNGPGAGKRFVSSFVWARFVELSRDFIYWKGHIVSHISFSCLISEMRVWTHDCGAVTVWDADASLSDATAEITCWTVQLSAVDEFSPFFSFGKSCFSSGLTGAIVTTLNHRSNYNRGLKWTVVVAGELIVSTLLMSLFVIVSQRSLGGSQTSPPPLTTTTTARDFSGRIMDSLLIKGQRIFNFFIFFFLTESKSISIHFDPRFESIYCGWTLTRVKKFRSRGAVGGTLWPECVFLFLAAGLLFMEGSHHYSRHTGSWQRAQEGC